MRQTRPLPDTHPELTVIHWEGFTEYRVENWCLARDGSGRVVRGTSTFSWVDMGVLVLAAICMMRGHEPIGLPLVCAAIALTWLCARFTQILHESLLVFPTLGVQLETHRGHPLIPRSLFTTRRFVPHSALEDVVIHEGLHGWNVRFYLALLQRRRASRALSSTSGTSVASGVSSALGISGELGVSGGGGAGSIEVHVVFENILPYFPVLKEVYLGVHQTLFPPSTRTVKDDPLVQDGDQSGDQS